MKNLMLLALIVGGGLAQASHVVCSSPNLYYSSVHGDFGTMPPHGMKTGSLTIVHQGKVLVKEDKFAGLGGLPVTKYTVDFIGPRKVLASTGSMVSGAQVYTETAVLRTLPPFAEEEVARGQVVCERTWAMVP